MTRVEFFTQDERICGFSVSGHSGYAKEGSDIVCAAISATVSFAEATIHDVLGEQTATQVDEGNAQITLKLPNVCENEDAVQAILAGMMVSLLHWRDEYPDYIEVMEV